MDRLVELELAGESKVLGEIMPQCRFVYYKTYMT
jgi:hypothetical protein